MTLKRLPSLWILVMGTLLGLLLTAVIGLGFFLADRLVSVYRPLVEASHELLLHASHAHLLIHDETGGAPADRARDAVGELELAADYARAMAEGGSGHWGTLHPLPTPELQTRIRSVRLEVDLMNRLAGQGLAEGWSDSLQERYAQLFHAFIPEVQALEAELHDAIEAETGRFHLTQLFLLLTILPLSLGFAFFVHRRVRERAVLLRDLEASRDHFRRIRRLGHIGYWQLDHDTGTLDWCEEIFELFELDPAHFTPSYQAVLEHVHPDDRQRVADSLSASLAERCPYDVEYRLLLPDGRVRHVRERCDNYYDEAGRPLRSLGLIQDITDSKEVEAALAAERAQAQRYLDVAGVMLVVVDRELRVELVNRRGCEILGRPEAEIVGQDFVASFVPAAEQPRLREVAERLFAGAMEGLEEIENKVLDGAGGERVIHWCNTLIRDDAGRVLRVLSSGEDVTEERRAMLELEREKRRFEALFRDAPLAICIAGADQRFVMVNPAFEALFGYPMDELRGHPTSLVYADPEAQRQAMARNDDGPAGESHELVLVRRDGEQFVGEMSAARLYDGDGRSIGHLAFCRDITERKEAEAKRLAFVEQQRDTLVREIHHRIKNHLQGVVGLLTLKATTDPVLREGLETVTSQVKSIALVYGLQLREVDGGVPMADLVTAITNAWKDIATIDFRAEGKTGAIQALLAHPEAVPVALILNELLSNAIKHSQGAYDGGEVVQVRGRCSLDGLVLEIRNRARLADGLALEQQDDPGHGLALARSMLPSQGANLSFEAGDGEVVATLRLTVPVVKVPHSAPEPEPAT